LGRLYRAVARLRSNNSIVLIRENAMSQRRRDTCAGWFRVEVMPLLGSDDATRFLRTPQGSSRFGTLLNRLPVTIAQEPSTVKPTTASVSTCFCRMFFWKSVNQLHEQFNTPAPRGLFHV
jgi:hypothetical protein